MKITENLKKTSINNPLEIKHPEISGLKIYIYPDEVFETILGTEVRMTSDKYRIEDNDNVAHPDHGVSIPEGEVECYIEELISQKTIGMFRYMRNLRKKGLNVGDRLIFLNGKQGVVVLPETEPTANNVLYVPLKNDGTLSKIKPRMLYERDSFTVYKN